VRPLLLAVLLIVVVPGVAEGAVTPGTYGGGALTANTGPSFLGTGSSWLWARVADDGTAWLGGALPVRCGLAFLRTRVALAPDGSFSSTSTLRNRRAGWRLRSRISIAGRFDGSAASGTVTANLSVRRPGRRTRRCSSGAAAWQLRIPGPPGPAAGPQPGATYYGLTSQGGRVPRAFLLAVQPDGARVKTTLLTFRARCRRLSYSSNDLSPGAAIRPDGTFTIRESFAFHSPLLVERVKVLVAGGFSAGGVAGAVRVHSAVRVRATGRVYDRCDTGPLTFAARL
jgi:hypothetical protein